MAIDGVRLDGAALTALLRGTQGLVAKDLTLKAQTVTNEAKRGCPVDTGRLRSSIRYAIFTDSEGVYAQVGSDVEYALFVHEGVRGRPGRPFLTDALAATGLAATV
jgi:hypothetical protein